LKKAKETISALIAMVGEYRGLLEIEKSEEEEKWIEKYKQEKEKMQLLIENLTKENSEMEEIVDEYELKIKELEEDRTKKNRETMENLQTLLKEMTYIEESNENLAREYEEEKQQHMITQEKLKTSQQIIEQLDFKVQRQDKQLTKLKESQVSIILSFPLFF
jgi:hypothetical protein